MVEGMNRNLIVVGVAACFVLAVPPACSSSTAPASCNALYSCCANADDPSSCSETAQNEMDAAVCEMELAEYVAQGLCTPEGGVIGGSDAGVDASHASSHDAGHS
jgi:hypothetical protein